MKNQAIIYDVQSHCLFLIAATAATHDIGLQGGLKVMRLGLMIAQVFETSRSVSMFPQRRS